MNKGSLERLTTGAENRDIKIETDDMLQKSVSMSDVGKSITS